VNRTQIFNQTQAYLSGAVDKIAETVVKIWNGMAPKIVGWVGDKSISNRSATTIMDVVKDAGHFAIPCAKLMAGKVWALSKSTLALAVAYPIIATSFALVFIVVPVFREYCAANERFTLKAPFVMIWMAATRPFRLMYRLLTVITGGAEVDMIRAKKALEAKPQPDAAGA
jgi:hypothetical protein